MLVMTALLGSCRSEKVAFQFRPVAPVAAVAPAAAAPTASVAAKPPASGAAKVPTSAAPTSFQRPAPVVALRRAGFARVLLPQPQREIQRAAAKKQLARQLADDETDIFHVVLGALVIVAGILLGLLLGGWLGLGVGVGVVILGYYFLMLGIGGPHAWREVFQEFFNM